MKKHKFKFGDLMENKIYEKYLKDQLKTANKYSPKNYFGNVDGIVANRNIDLMNILSKNNIIELNKENAIIIDKFNENLFKIGIKFGISDGKQVIISLIKRGDKSVDKLMNMDSEKITTFNYVPTYILDMKRKLK